MKKLLTLLGLLTMPSTLPAAEFKVGQVWDYQTRSNEVGSQLTVVQIDSLNGHEIVHISVSGLQIKSPQAPTGYGNAVSHLPISQDALKSSVTKLANKVKDLPDYQEVYQIWREAFDSGEGGIFSISVAECIDYMEQAINQ